MGASEDISFSSYKNFSLNNEYKFDNLIISGAIRSGKTEKAIEIIAEAVRKGKNFVYVCRSHEQCKDVVKRLDEREIAAVHVASEKWKDFDYETRFSFSPKEFHSKWANTVKKTGREIPQIKYAEHLVKTNYIDGIITVPELFLKLFYKRKRESRRRTKYDIDMFEARSEGSKMPFGLQKYIIRRKIVSEKMV